jgi:hypothetical protein
MVRRIGGRKSHPGLHRVLANVGGVRRILLQRNATTDTTAIEVLAT